jgi:hypothetical protein
MDRLEKKANEANYTCSKKYIVDNLQEWDQHLTKTKFIYIYTKYKISKILLFEFDITYIPKHPLDIVR